MLKIFSFACVTFCASACTSQPEPQPDPHQVERLVASLKDPAEAPAEVQEKLAKADRIVATVDRAEPDRLAGAAERMLLQ